MPSSSDTAYSARFLLPDLIERETECTLRCPVHRDGAVVAPTGGTVSLLGTSGRPLPVLDEQSVVVVDGVARVTVTLPATEALGEGLQVRWTLTLEGRVHRFHNDAAVVRRRLYCPITDADLYAVARGLDPASSDPITSLQTYQGYIDEAWTQVQLRLIGEGNRPNLVMSPTSLREVAQQLTLALIFEDLADRQSNAGWREQGASHRDRYEAAWARLNFLYAAGDAEAPSARERRPGARTVWLGTRRG